ncbi:HNH endonuclease [Oceaniglobus roseus]|uniref:HNH endonuclease n=1 Tax=Oceaniglobus roseus TaxID=1737570 RepID=UPI000C7EA9B7|nr:HNH endonuclease [Kandeliimicrobium roseum]
MSRGRDATQPTRLVVWGRAAGRCQYTNCGEELAGDLITGDLAKNHAYLAHIIASNPDGPRGHPVLSHEKSDDPDNLMLLCDRHHREIDDRSKLDIYTVDALLEMKRRHEERISRALKDPDAPSAHILRVSAAVGDNETAIPRQACAQAMIPQLVIADRHPIDISIRGFEHKDSDPGYYQTELTNLRRVYDREIRGRFRDGDLEHLAVFGFAPIPLLMELGRLLSDLSDVTVFGRHREPQPGWAWPDDSPELSFERRKGSPGHKRVALKLAVSAEISDNRVTSVLGDDVSIWEIRSSEFGTNVLRNRSALSDYRKLVGRVFDEIKTEHGPHVCLSIFPAVPTTCAIEFGRAWQPKAHPAFDIYDQTPSGFVCRHRISRTPQT